MVNNWQFQGGVAPVLKDAQLGLQFRYTVDGTAEHTLPPNCNSDSSPPEGIIEFEYSFKTRLRIWNSRCSQLRVWLCDDSRLPSLVSVLNISDSLQSRGIKPLEPGPHVLFSLDLTDRLASSALASLQEFLCKVVWTVLDERCSSRVWMELSTTQAGRTSTPFRLTLHWIFVSNSRTARASYLLLQAVRTQNFRIQYPQVVDMDSVIDSSDYRIYAPGPYPKLNRASVHGCVTHYDCYEGLFCSLKTLQQAARGFQGSGLLRIWVEWQFLSVCILPT